jgi:hypothetical protein
VPDEMTFAFMDAVLGKLVAGGAALRLGFPAVVAPFHMGIALGIARRALDEITRQAVGKGRNFQLSPVRPGGAPAPNLVPPATAVKVQAKAQSMGPKTCLALQRAHPDAP